MSLSFENSRESGSVYYRTMTIEEWINVPDNPIQRDTEARFLRAKHLHTWDDNHAHVDACELDGHLIKADGHTRSLVWARGILVPPVDHVNVRVWPCKTIGDVKNQYLRIDSRAAVDQTPDLMYGAIRDNTLQFKSDLLKSQRFAEGLRRAYIKLFGENTPVAHYHMIKYWAPELKLLDQCMPTRQAFPTGIQQGAFITLRKDGPDGLDFWKAYASDIGSKAGAYMDGVQALADRVERLRQQKKLTGHSNIISVFGAVIVAYDKYQTNELVDRASGLPRYGDKRISQFIIEAKRPRRGW
jgi:hypothetical protein